MYVYLVYELPAACTSIVPTSLFLNCLAVFTWQLKAYIILEASIGKGCCVILIFSFT